MKEFKAKYLRTCGLITDQFVIAIALSEVAMYGGALLSVVLFSIVGGEELFSRMLGSDNLGAFLAEYLSFTGIWVAIWLFAKIPAKNRPMLKSWKHHKHGNNLKGSLIGIALGFGTNGFCVLMSLLMGDIKLTYYGFDPWILLVFLVAIFIQSAAEELIDRLYLYQKLRRRYKNPLVAILVNAIAFSAMHLLNPGFTAVSASQIFLIGITFSVIVYYYDSLWTVMWFHAAWNYTQNIIFGLPNSGIISEYSVFKLDAASATNGLFYNVGFGVEGSVGAVLVLLALLIIIVVINRGKPEKTDRWAEAEREAMMEPKHAMHAAK